MALESVLFSVARLAALPARGQPSINSLITLRERIRFDQIGLVKHLGLAIRLPLADAELAPQMMVAIVNSHVPFGRPFEFHAGRSRGNLVNVEAAALFDGSFHSHGPRYAACVTSPMTDFSPYLALNALTNPSLFGFWRLWKYFIAE